MKNVRIIHTVGAAALILAAAAPLSAVANTTTHQPPQAAEVTVSDLKIAEVETDPRFTVPNKAADEYLKFAEMRNSVTAELNPIVNAIFEAQRMDDRMALAQLYQAGIDITRARSGQATQIQQQLEALVKQFDQLRDGLEGELATGFYQLKTDVDLLAQHEDKARQLAEADPTKFSDNGVANRAIANSGSNAQFIVTREAVYRLLKTGDAIDGVEGAQTHIKQTALAAKVDAAVLADQARIHAAYRESVIYQPTFARLDALMGAQLGSLPQFDLASLAPINKPNIIVDPAGTTNPLDRLPMEPPPAVGSVGDLQVLIEKLAPRIRDIEARKGGQQS